jgi:hypothetical protein
MRSIEIAEDFALHLARLRALARSEGWAQAPAEGAPTPLRVVDLEALEQGLGFSLPDPAIAYIAAGVSCWGDGPVRLADVLEKTLFVQESLIEAGGSSERTALRFAVIDDDSNGNYIAVKKGTSKGSDRVYFLDHEDGFALKSPTTLTQSTAQRLEKYETPEADAPFVVELDHEAPPAPPAVMARHSKFGVGRVIADEGETVTITFETVGEKRLKRSFVTFE